MHAKGMAVNRMNKIKKLAFAGAASVLLLGGLAGAVFASTNSSFQSRGTGTEASLSLSGCQFTSAGCIVESTGTGTTSHMGPDTYVSTLTVHWALATSNKSGGFCAPADGPTVITAANGDNDTVTLQNVGIVCEVGATALHAPHTFNGLFTISGGTGDFAGATGSGTVTGGDNGYDISYYTASGTIAY